jgi:hypothetical protein
MAVDREPKNLVRIGNMFTRVDGCDMDSKCGGTGYFEKFVRLKPEEALQGKATRECKLAGEIANLTVEVDGDGNCSANCTTTSCEYNSANRQS